MPLNCIFPNGEFYGGFTTLKKLEDKIFRKWLLKIYSTKIYKSLVRQREVTKSEENITTGPKNIFIK